MILEALGYVLLFTAFVLSVIFTGLQGPNNRTRTRP